MNHDRLRETLDLELDGAAVDESLSAAEKARLEEHLASCAECRVEREGLLMLHERLSAAVVEPRAGFAGEVMRALGPAPWEARALVVWRWPFALLLGLGGLAAVLLGGAAAELEPRAGSFDAFMALARLLESAALAGAGLLGASWKGLGSGLAEWLGASKLNLAGAGVLLLALNLLFLRLLRATPSDAQVSDERGGRRGGSAR
jgi:predicted anti-sigma-YlaC factor YlaD